MLDGPPQLGHEIFWLSPLLHYLSKRQTLKPSSLELPTGPVKRGSYVVDNLGLGVGARGGGGGGGGGTSLGFRV